MRLRYKHWNHSIWQPEYKRRLRLHYRCTTLQIPNKDLKIFKIKTLESKPVQNLSFLWFLLRYYKASCQLYHVSWLLYCWSLHFFFLYNCSWQRFTNAAQRCIKAVYRPYGLVWLFFCIFTAALLQLSVSLPQRSRSHKNALLQRTENSVRATFLQRSLQR